jgi:hypothetical protein
MIARARRAAAALMFAALVATPAPAAAAIGGIASIPDIVLAPNPAVHQTQQIWMQVSGADVTFEVPTALGKLVGSVELQTSSGYRGCGETSANHIWSCGDNASGIAEMRVSYDADAVYVDTAADYEVRVGQTDNRSTSPNYGTRSYAIGTATVKATSVPKADAKVTALDYDKRDVDGKTKVLATIANSGPAAADATLTFSGYGSTRLIPTGDSTCHVNGSTYACRYQLASGESVAYALELTGSPDTLHMTITAKISTPVTTDDPVPTNNSRTLTLPPPGYAPHASSTPGSAGSSGSSGPAGPPGSPGSSPAASSPSDAAGPQPSADVYAEAAAPSVDSSPIDATGTSPAAGGGAWWIWLIAALALAGLGAAAYVIRRAAVSRHATRTESSAETQ